MSKGEIDLALYQEVLEKAEQHNREAQRLAGAVGERRKELQREFGCKTLKEARAKIKELEDEEAKLARSLKKELDEMIREISNHE